MRRILALIQGFLRRLADLSIAPFYDFVFIHREATPIGPPVVEWIIAKIFNKKIIYDFDDAIWLTDRQEESVLLRTLKWRTKIKNICRWSYKISCGNEYLCSYARTFNKNTIYNPTTIDTDSLHNPALYSSSQNNGHLITIGWTGSHSTLKYLKTIEFILKKIQEQHANVQFLVIADRKPELSFPIKFIPWNAESEIIDLLQINIGIMPLPDDAWTKGKGGFKALQYMALKIPSIVSPVGINTTIVKHGVDGFIATSSDEWAKYLTGLIKDESLRKKFGEVGRKKVVDFYSVKSNAPTFLSLFE